MDIKELERMYKESAAADIYDACQEVDVEQADVYGVTALHLACKYADSKGVRILLERGAEVNACDRDGNRTPLHYLAVQDEYGKHEAPGGETRKCALLLLEAGASVIRKDNEGITPLLEAASRGRHELLEAAVEKGVRLTATDKKGNTALHLICGWGIKNAMEKLERAEQQEKRIDRAEIERAKQQLDACPADDPYRFMYESSYRMCREDADKKIKEAARWRATVEGFFLSAKALLEGGLDPQEKNNDGKTPLDLAIANKAGNISSLLSGTWSEEGGASKTKGMDIYQAIEALDYEALSGCIEEGADLNALCDRDGIYNGLTPLCIACYMLDLKAIELLLAAGADPNYRNASGQTAVAYWFFPLQGRLPGRYFYSSEVAKAKIPSKIVKALAAAGFDINATVSDSEDTMLIAACRNAQPGLGIDIAKELLRLRADVDRSNKDGQTALMLLCESYIDDPAVSNLYLQLLEAGAAVAAVDRRGNTPLHYAATHSGTVGKARAEALFDFGDPNPAAVNNEGKTALDLASEKNNEPLVKLILMNS